jgi:hypothetical protein
LSARRGLWSAEHPAAFLAGSTQQWHWTMMIVQPEWLTAEMTAEAIRVTAKNSNLPGPDRMRLERGGHSSSRKVTSARHS